MSSILPAGKAVDTLETLKAVVEEFSSRAGKLNEEFRTQVAREQRRFEAARDEQAAGAAAAQVEANASLQTARNAAQTSFERRKVRIGKAYQSSKEQGLQDVDNQIGGRKYELQRRMLQAERDREAALANQTGAAQQFQNELSAEQEALSRVERMVQGAFKGYPGFQRVFLRAYETSEVDCASDQHRLLAQLRDLIGKAAGEAGRFRGLLLVRLFRFVLLWVVLAAGFFALVPAFRHFGIAGFGLREAAVCAGVTLLLTAVLRFLARRQSQSLVEQLSRTLARARRIHDACRSQADQNHQNEFQRIQDGFVQTTHTVDQQLKQTLSQAGELRVSCRMKTDERAVHANKSNEKLLHNRLQRLDNDFQTTARDLRQAAEVRARAMAEAWEKKRAELSAALTSRWKILDTEWRARSEPLYRALQDTQKEAQLVFPPWSAPAWAKWTPPAQFSRHALFARLNIDFAELCPSKWQESGLHLPGESHLPVPLCLAYPGQGSLLIETADASGHDPAIAALNNVILRLLSTAPPGRLNFTILDPVGLGQNFAGVMHLADYEEQLINSRIWTQASQIEEKLGALNEHMEKVIQMYLRNEYQTIAEYNEQAGVIAEKYHFLVIADFPANFSDVAARRLMSIAASGARCGVFMLIHWDNRQPAPQDFIPEELRKNCFCIASKAGQALVSGKPFSGAKLSLEQPPPPEIATDFIHQVGQLSKDSSRVEVPFDHVSPPEQEIWTADTSVELRVPVGRTGATKLQYLEIGKGTRQHGLVAGKTGSGKSTLFHVLITNLSLWCSPEQVEFYLVDFKKGVEFKCYATQRLPHARVVAIESDREFGLSVLQRVDDELRRRGDLFRQLGAQDLAGYKRAGGKEPLPRTLLLIDEFQEYFVEDDKIAQTASLLLDRIVRQGRAFGIHVLLGSQTLGGAYTVARTTLGQMVIRIALQCNEADAYLIMDDTNPAPRLLSRPGEGIYNDMAGALEGNSPFQVVWLPEQVRDAQLAKVRARADQSGLAYAGPIVFEGNAPAEVRENLLLRQLLEIPSRKPVVAGRIWLGAPNSIKGPTEVIFRRQSGNNLLIVGQRDEAILAMLGVGLVALAAQYAPAAARVILCDTTPPGTAHREFLDQVTAALPLKVQMPRVSELPALLKELAAEMKQRAEAPDPDAAPPVFLFINGAQKFAKLRYEEDFSFSGEPADAKPGALLNDLICEGARLGFHVIAVCDTYNNVTRFFSRKALSEFEMRVLFQMSANDSASLIDNPKAGMLGLHRALYFNAQEGYLETFRPYALPGPEWIDYARARLSPENVPTAT